MEQMISPTRRAFSLVEMLVVAAIMLILMTLALFATQSIANGYRLGSAGNQFVALLERARIHATTTQKVAVFRLYADPDTKDPQTGLRALQVLERVPDPAAPLAAPVIRPVSRIFRLENPLIVSWSHSSALSNSNLVAGTTNLAGTSNLPYREFYVFPDGSTSLSATAVNPYFTLVTARDDIALKNPAVVSLDPVTARATLFRR